MVSDFQVNIAPFPLSRGVIVLTRLLAKPLASTLPEEGQDGGIFIFIPISILCTPPFLFIFHVLSFMEKKGPKKATTVNGLRNFLAHKALLPGPKFLVPR
jgi:hypothetical protein